MDGDTSARGRLRRFTKDPVALACLASVAVSVMLVVATLLMI